MGEEEDPQRLKRIAASAYDYDRDPRWLEYWSNVLIPPRLASRSDVVDHYKRKFFQRHIDPGLVVEPMTVTSSSQSSRTMNTSASPPVPEQTRPSNTGATSGKGATASSSTTSYSMPFERQTIQFFIHTWVLLTALLCIAPLVPRQLASKAYRISMMSSAGSSMYFLYMLYGAPKGWNAAAIRTWFQSVIIVKDFIYLVYCLMFASSSPEFKSALLPLIYRAVEHNAKYLKRNISHSSLYRKCLEGTCSWVEKNTITLNTLSSNTEIVLGFLSVVYLFTWQRNIILTFIYWHLLKLMYHSPATAGCHQSSWARIGRALDPYVSSYTPFLNTPLTAIQRWWAM